MPLKKFRVLVLSPGAKIALVRALVEAVGSRGGTLTAWESDHFSPGATMCHARVDGGSIEDESSARRLLAHCLKEQIRLVVPSRHDDLPALSLARDSFARAGVDLIVSSPDCVALCFNKISTHTWLAAHGFPVPAQTIVAGYAASAMHGQFPIVAKHPRGSGSRQVRLCRSHSEIAQLPFDWILQSHAPGREYTVNAYVDRSGRSLCEIPHERLVVADGEVVRARSARQPTLMALARKIAESLPGARGPLNIQIFWEESTNTATVIEINPRFGGGYPLCHRAGGRFTDWLLGEYVDGDTPPRLDAWESDLLMVRFRESLFFPASPSESR